MFETVQCLSRMCLPIKFTNFESLFDFFHICDFKYHLLMLHSPVLGLCWQIGQSSRLGYLKKCVFELCQTATIKLGQIECFFLGMYGSREIAML